MDNFLVCWFVGLVSEGQEKSAQNGNPILCDVLRHETCEPGKKVGWWGGSLQPSEDEPTRPNLQNLVAGSSIFLPLSQSFQECDSIQEFQKHHLILSSEFFKIVN